ncbi:MAG: TonB-dependent receptor [Sphingomonas sp.]
MTATVGYAFTDTRRITDRRAFLFQGNGSIPLGVSLLRPDLLLEPTVIDYFKVALVDNEGGNPAFRATLRTHAGYAQIQAQILPELSLNAGVRYEKGTQAISPIRVYTTLPSLPPATNIQRHYWLPAATLTLQLNPEMQLRLSGSKTIARPQFREQVFQTYYDPESNSLFRGNPQLIDSQLYNGEARYEWYFRARSAARGRRLLQADRSSDRDLCELRRQHRLHQLRQRAQGRSVRRRDRDAEIFRPLASVGRRFLGFARAVVIANYTYTKSKVKVGANDPVAAYPLAVTRANQLFRDGSPLTGQSITWPIWNWAWKTRTICRSRRSCFPMRASASRGAGPRASRTSWRTPASTSISSRARASASPGSRPSSSSRSATSPARAIRISAVRANRIYYNLYDVGRSASLGLNVNF